MNTPNKLTILRIIMIPFFIAFFLWGGGGWNYFFAALIFSVASITDLIDGRLARKNNQVTNFGKLMDPLADKLLVTSALICFVHVGAVGAVPIIIIIAREFLVTSVRMLALESGKVIAANNWGKLKTVIQMVAIITSMLILFAVGIFSWFPQFVGNVAIQVMMWLSAGITLISGATYIWDNRTLMRV